MATSVAVARQGVDNAICVLYSRACLDPICVLKLVASMHMNAEPHVLTKCCIVWLNTECKGRGVLILLNEIISHCVLHVQPVHSPAAFTKSEGVLH